MEKKKIGKTISAFCGELQKAKLKGVKVKTSIAIEVNNKFKIEEINSFQTRTKVLHKNVSQGLKKLHFLIFNDL